jgi:hypothetical protein
MLACAFKMSVVVSYLRSSFILLPKRLLVRQLRIYRKIFISWWSVIFRISPPPPTLQALIADYTHCHNVAVKIFRAIAPSFTRRNSAIVITWKSNGIVESKVRLQNCRHSYTSLLLHPHNSGTRLFSDSPSECSDIPLGIFRIPHLLFIRNNPTI